MIPKLTVAIPVFNEQYKAVRAIASVINQDWDGKKEILVVNDGSTDGTGEVLARLVQRIPELRVITHDSNLGRPAARTTLAKEARGEYFAMLDADDQWFTNKLSRQFKLMETSSLLPDAERLIICGNIRHVDLDNDSERIKNFAKAYGDSYSLRRLLAGDNTPISQLCLLRTSFLREVGEFDARLKRAQDWDFLIRAFTLGAKMRFVSGAPLATFYFTKHNRSAHLVRECMYLVIEKHKILYQRYGVDPAQVRASIASYIERFSE
jgi:glycosyltransferase involved in cell wall biosynthesis